ncbi:MAG: antitoxin [Erysipelotrichaceae bacterium]|jgi:predicted DNA binding CopG/RHH family protein|nr:antitoxin [Erysipelotrichaceae bacterium]
MKDHYDFSKGIKNPYAKLLKKQITINIDIKIVEYFKEMANQVGIPYQNLINLYLLDCVKNKREIKFS